MRTESLEQLATLSFELGLPQETLVSFLNNGYVPQPKQMQFHAKAELCNDPDGPSRVCCGGVRGQAKSHAILAQVGMVDCQRHPDLKVLYLRKIKQSASEQFQDLIRKVFKHLPYKYVNSTLYFPNGSRILFGGFRSESDIDGYIGIEYDLVIIEDATTLSKIKYNMIEGSVRTSKETWRPRIYLSANPGGIGQTWVKRTFYLPWERKEEDRTRFIHFKMGDNVFIDPDYEKYLLSLTGWLKTAWADGDFETAAGAYFTNWDEHKHVVETVKPNRDWVFWMSKDYGNKHWNVTLLFGRTPYGQTYVLEEIGNRETKIKVDATQVIDMGFRYPTIHQDNFLGRCAGPDMWTKRNDERRGQISVADLYEEYGLSFIRATTDRVNGAQLIQNMLGEGQLFIHKRCKRLIEQIPEMLHDPKRGEDYLKIDCDPETGEGGDDYVDTLRYGLATPFDVEGDVDIDYGDPYS